jgi:mxaJ protein
MSSLFRNVLLVVLAWTVVRTASAISPLRICADPDNLPFSNRAGNGFENRIAVLLAEDLHRNPIFVSARGGRGFLRERFNKNACDLLMGVPAGMRAVASSRPYYRSTYVFVTPRRKHIQIASFNDSHLDGRRIGLQILEEDLSPPSVPLIRDGHAGQIVGFESFGAQSGDIVRAVSTGRIGTAVVWGPVAGYFTASMHLPLVLTPVSPTVDPTGIPFTFALTVGVHKNDIPLREAIDSAIQHLQPQIDKILAEYHVPTVASPESAR